MLGQSVYILLLRGRALLWALTRRELQSRYAGSAAGVLWAYLQPILTVAAYYLVFDVVFAMRLGDSAPTKAVGTYLIVGALPWMAFGDALSRGASSLVDAGGLLQKNALPPAFIPARTVVASALVFTPLMVLLVLAYWPMHHGVWAALLAVPLLWIAQTLMVFWMALMLSILAAAMRDITQFLMFALQMGIFLSPALFPYAQFPEVWRWVLWLNPMTPLLLGYQNALLQGIWPVMNIWMILLVWLTLFAGVAKLLYARSKDQVVDWL